MHSYRWFRNGRYEWDWLNYEIQSELLSLRD